MHLPEKTPKNLMNDEHRSNPELTKNDGYGCGLTMKTTNPNKPTLPS